MVVVSDTSPINYLVLIGHVDVLRSLFGRLVIPKAVLDELMHADAPDAVREWAEARPDWVEVLQVAGVGTSEAALDRGEQEAIALARSLNADLILLDERQGRACATALGLKVIGTVGVLVQAAGAELLSLPEAIGRLRQTTFRISEQLLAAAIEHDRHR